MRQLFGTDGIRAKAHEYPLDPSTMFALGAALAERLATPAGAPMILLGMDTRESGPEIAGSLAAGIAAGGGRAVFVGVVPTPAVAYLCTQTDSVAGISISASHNPFGDNGVKVFGHDGMKVADSIELELENALLARRTEKPFEPLHLKESPELVDLYEQFLINGIDRTALAGRRIILDTGHGAAYRIAPDAFRRLGAEIDVINDAPNGTNINENAGALHPEKLAEVVVARGAEWGVAFDGDADRAIFVDDRGTVRNGDEILYLWAEDLASRGQLSADTVVATVMSNLGFEKKLNELGIRLLRANVGDKYVLESMIANGAVLGGEQSGHVIDLRTHSTGDGIHTALAMAQLLGSGGRRFSERETFTPMPQVLINERVASKPPLETLPVTQAAIRRFEADLNGRGRILVRYSGTENMVRVMTEGEDGAKISEIARQLVDTLKGEIGAA